MAFIQTCLDGATPCTIRLRPSLETLTWRWGQPGKKETITPNYHWGRNCQLQSTPAVLEKKLPNSGRQPSGRWGGEEHELERRKPQR